MIPTQRGWNLPMTLSCMLVVKVSEVGAGMLHISWWYWHRRAGACPWPCFVCWLSMWAVALYYRKQICQNYVPNRRGGGHIVFGADPVGVGVSVSVTLSCLHVISWTIGWNVTKFASLYKSDYVSHRKGGGHIGFWCDSHWCRHQRDTFLFAWYLMNRWVES